MFKLIQPKSFENPRTKPMNKMEPLEIGRIIEDCDHKNAIVMRSASMSHFEVFHLSKPNENRCWEKKYGYCVLLVELLPPETQIILEVV